jgi:FixJ family two-component response regulator
MEAPELDLTDAASIAAAVAATQPELVINAAAYTAVDRAEDDRALAFAVNATGPRLLGEAAARAGIPVVHFSTDYVFDGAKPTPYVETDAPDPIGAYGEPIPVPNIPTLSPDPAGTRGAYFVGDFAKGETLSQSIYLNPGLYRVGFSLYVPQNGQGNRGDATLTASLLGLNLADLKISTTATKQWLTFSGIAPISFGGQYLASFVFNTNFLPSKDVIIDQVYVAAIPAPAALGLFAAALAGLAVRDSLQWLLEGKDHRVRCFDSAETFLSRYDAREVACLIVDIRMGGMSGLELQDKLIERKSPLPVVFITGHGDVPMAVDTMKKGAMDFIQKPFKEAELVPLVERMLEHAKDAFADHQQAASRDALMSKLTTREAQVLERIVAGRLNKQIADDLGISIKTVEAHRANIMEKLNANTVADLLKTALGQNAAKA